MTAMELFSETQLSEPPFSQARGVSVFACCCERCTQVMQRVRGPWDPCEITGPPTGQVPNYVTGINGLEKGSLNVGGSTAKR